jgi:hypothetical protein
MAITLHWIGPTHSGDIELQTALGGFRYIKEKHSGENIAAKFVDILKELDILDRIGGITMDNAQNNDMAMQTFEQHLSSLGMTYIPEQQRIRCFSHIVNLAATDAVEAFAMPHLFDLRHVRDADLKAAWRDGQSDTGYSDALKTDLIDRIHNVVRNLRSSGQRREAFRQTIVRGNQEKRFINPVPLLQLLRPVPTRWSSTFMMIDRFLQLMPAINLFLDTPNVASLTRDDTLNVRETSVANDMRELLSYLHAAQEMLAGEQCPTLSFALPVFEDLFGALKDLRKPFPKLMHAIHASLEKLEKYRQECQRSHLYVLAMGMSLYSPLFITYSTISHSITPCYQIPMG